MAVSTALIVDDEADIRELIEFTLQPMGVACHSAATLNEAKSLLKKINFDFCITDLKLPDGNGTELLSLIQKQSSNIPVAVITAHGNVETAVESLKLGAFDYISKPFELGTLRNLVSTALKLKGNPKTFVADQAPQLIGSSSAMEHVRTLIKKLARSQAPILITGESGTGKELAARSIHIHSPRADNPFIPVNCGAVPEQLLESEFFGYKKGSFTGATHDKVGLFQAAQGGTLFLDEVADLPLHMQVKLLRAIQERAVRPIGGSSEISTDVRILSATHKDLINLVSQGSFRQDLYYRLNVIELRMPSLRERSDDIPEFAQHILGRLSQQHGLSLPRLTNSALESLVSYPFPGNIREMENILERAFTLCEGNIIDSDDLNLQPVQHSSPTFNFELTNPPQTNTLLPLPERTVSPTVSPILPLPSDTSLENYLEELERDAITRALEATRYNKTAAAEKLGISFRALRYRLKKLGID